MTAWARRHLFRTRSDAALTLVFGALALYVAYRALRFLFVTGRWEIVEVNLRLLMVGRFPTQHLPRISVTLIVLAAWAGVLAGLVRSRQVRAGRPVPVGLRARAIDLLERLWIPSAVCLLLLAMTTTAGPWLTAGGVVVGAVVGRLIGGLLGRVRLGGIGGLAVALALGAVPIALFFYLVDAIGYDDWEGFMLNLFLALCSIVLCFPLGVLLALGRRSSLPIIRGLSTTYIELVRGAPLFVLLLLANVALQFFIPADRAPSTATRAIVVFTHVHRGIHGRDRARRPAVGAQGAVRGGQGARALADPADRAHRAAAGAAQRHPGPDRPAHQPVQGHEPRRRGDGSVRVDRGVDGDHAAG